MSLTSYLRPACLSNQIQGQDHRFGILVLDAESVDVLDVVVSEVDELRCDCLSRDPDRWQD